MVKDIIKNNKLFLTVVSITLMNVWLVSYTFKYKSFLLLLSLSITFIQIILNWKEVEKWYFYLIKPNNQGKISLAGFFTFFAILSLLLAVYLLGSGFKEFARDLLIPFVGFSFLSSIFICFELDGSFLKKMTTNLRWIFGVSTPLIYYSASALANSVFLQISTLEMSKSPWLAFLLTMAFFIIFFSIFVHFVYYFILILPRNKLNNHQTIVGLVILGAITLLMNVIILSTGNLAYLSIDNGIAFEWRKIALCAGNAMSNNEGYYYYGFNTDKYIAYRKDGKRFFFDELTCSREKSGGYVFKKASISADKIPRWFEK